ncbi:MAG: UDP-N-acetylglucosamine 2-epimerase (non-hydrolyzing) [Oscillospiraceae bacterium]
MKKIVTVVGARPQFIKAAAVSHKLREHFTEILVHTGQHYDYNMSDCFFEELSIPKPDYNLGIQGASHGQMTGEMLIAIEKLLLAEKPDMLLVYGDTNSTLAAALAAAKLAIPIAHVEAGVRTGSITNPEEINRRCTDCIASLNLVCTNLSLENLQGENLGKTAHFVGDPMYDAFINFGQKARQAHHNLTLNSGKTVEIPEEFYYLTCHRQENTACDDTLIEILSAMQALPHPTIYPVHPRNKQRAAAICKDNKFSNIILCQPVGYLTSIYLVSKALEVVTDSGGLQREAFFAEVQCVTVLPFPVWQETLVDNRNVLCAPRREEILEKVGAKQHIDKNYHPFGEGNSAENIIKCMTDFFKEKD